MAKCDHLTGHEIDFGINHDFINIFVILYCNILYKQHQYVINHVLNRKYHKMIVLFKLIIHNKFAN